MRVVFRFFVLLLPIIALSIFGSLKLLQTLEERWLVADLERRSLLIYESVHDYVSESLEAKRVGAISKLLNRLAKDERLTGAMVCGPDGKIVAKSSAVPSEIDCERMSERAASKDPMFVQSGDVRLHEAVVPVQDEGQPPQAYLVILHDTSYMSRRHATTKRYVLALLAFLSVAFFVVTLLIYRWSMSDVVRRMGGVFKGLLTGDAKAIELTRGEFSPLAKDLSKVVRELRHAKSAARETDAANAWTPSRLRHEVQKLFGDSQLCVIANREPYVHNRKGGKVEVLLPASGLVTAVEPLVRACSGLWIAHGSGTADRETADAQGKLLVPPGAPEYALKRVWLSKAEEQGYYYGFSNEGLWPLCHIAHARPHFDSDDWAKYQLVNRRFAEKFAEESWEGRPIVLIQDYHFALLPKLIREKKPDSILSLFWHIPWPNPEAFGICPWKKELLEGMLGADLIGFHTQFHCNNFLDTVDRYLEARVDRERFTVTIRGHTCTVKPFAISVEWPARHEAPSDGAAVEKERLMTSLGLPKGTKIGIGVDRVDYTKGIIERFRAVEKLLERHPEWVGKFTFVQIGAPSRTHIKRYQDLNHEVQELADKINWKFAQAEVPPITLLLAHHNAPELFQYYRAADVCFVSSLHDGMNLVAKEYVSAQDDLNGVLVLSTFAGASRELTEALLVNPYDIEECAGALHRALTMDPVEKAERMRRLRAVVGERNVYAWGGSFLAEIHRIAQLKDLVPGKLA